MTDTYYKALGEHGEAIHGGRGVWYLPKGNRPGKWMPKIDDIEPCMRGYHILKPEHILTWLSLNLWEVEVRGEVIWEADKGVCAQARLVRKVETINERTLRLFAADCAERVLPIFEKVRPKDNRPRLAIQAARDFANGSITRQNLAAAMDAAMAAAGAAAMDAAMDAAWAAAGAAAMDAAMDATDAAAWAAAMDAAWAAALATERDARGDERKWQTQRLMEYIKGEA